VEAAGERSACPFISADGKRLVFERWTSDYNFSRLILDGGLPTGPATPFLASTRLEASPTYSPDGKRIAFTSDRSGPVGLWTAEADGTSAREIFSRQDCSAFQPEWSPDGRHLVFVLNEQGRNDIYKISVQGGKPVRLTSDPMDEFTPYWSRDGQWIYFTSSRRDRFQVHKISVVGGESIPITSEGGFAPRQSPSGEWLYYSGDDSDHQTLWRVKTTEGKRERVLTDVYRRSFMPFDDCVYFVTQISDRQFEIRFMAFKDRAVTTVDRIDYSPQGPLTISPDKKTLLITRVEGENADLMMLENFR